MSFSGLERNQSFLNREGQGFMRASYLVGADAAQDGRVATRADLDCDGAEELIVVSRNAPLLRIFRRQPPERALLIRLAKDPVGARVDVACGDRIMRRDLLGGEGLGTQPSRAIVVTLADCETAQVTVRWPDGARQSLGELGPGLYFVDREQVRRQGLNPTRGDVVRGPATDLARLLEIERITYVSLWASWCRSCKRAQPGLNRLRARFREEAGFLALAVDPDDTDAKIAEHAARIDYPIRRLSIDRSELDRLLLSAFGRMPALPSGLLIEPGGRILWVQEGVPTVSDLTMRLPRAEPKPPWPWPFIGLTVALSALGWFLLRRRSR